MKLIEIDFEFHSPNEQDPVLISCALGTKGYWLFDGSDTQRLIDDIERYHDEGYTFLAYALVAEARCFLALGLDPWKYRFIDLFLEYRCLQNHSHELSYGKQLIGGKLVTTRPPKPKWQQTEEDKKGKKSNDPEQGLAAASYKLLDVLIDTEEKDQVRDYIISRPGHICVGWKDRILKYNISDNKYLVPLYEKMVAIYTSRLRKFPDLLKLLPKDMKYRADYAVATAIMERIGYPVVVEDMRNLTDSVRSILTNCITDINSQFKEKPFRWNRADKKFSMRQKELKLWIAKQPFADRWLRTKTGDYSLALDAWKQHFDFRHDYPRNNLGAQMVRYLVLKQNISGFIPKKDSRTIWDSTGSDGRVRPYYNIYGSQSSRSQPSSTSFIYLKSAWMRSLVQPPKGLWMVGVDYGSEEFLLDGLYYNDKAKIEAYHSGDPYLWFAKEAGEVPRNGQRKDYEEIRDKFKSTTLGLQYKMSKYGLSTKLTQDIGKFTTEEEAQELIDMFDEIFYESNEGSEDLLHQYYEDGFLRLPCGWYMWGDNDNERSIKNCPIQGLGGSIMRKAVIDCLKKGVDITITLHDALYALVESGDVESIDILIDCMDKAFKYYFRGEAVEKDAKIRMDGVVFGPDIDVKEIVTPKGRKLKATNYYIDSRAIQQYETFKSYMRNKPLVNLV